MVMSVFTPARSGKYLPPLIPDQCIFKRFAILMGKKNMIFYFLFPCVLVMLTVFVCVFIGCLSFPFCEQTIFFCLFSVRLFIIFCLICEYSF